MNILFIDNNNQFRSKVAEFFFKRYNSHGRFECKSAGAFGYSYWFDRNIKKLVEKFGIKMEGRPKKLDRQTWLWADLIIVMGDDISVELTEDDKYQGKEVIEWNVDKLEHFNEKEIKEKIIQIGRNVKEFCESI